MCIRDSSSIFVGNKEFEIMKKPGRGTNGHIAIGCNNVDLSLIHIFCKHVIAKGGIMMPGTCSAGEMQQAMNMGCEALKLSLIHI